MLDGFDVQKGAILFVIFKHLNLAFMLRMIDNKEVHRIIWQQQDTKKMFKKINIDRADIMWL